MGTTVTTNLGLIKPDGSESIRENLPTFPGWADQNADNCDVIDALFRATSHTYVPTWTAPTLNPTLGATGFIEGKYLRIFPRMVIGFIRIYAGGAGFNPGTGQYAFSAPATVAPEFAQFSDSVPIGKAVFYDDSSVLDSSAWEVLYNVALGNLYLRITAGGAWSNTNPVVLAQQDRMSCYFMYPTSDA